MMTVAGLMVVWFALALLVGRRGRGLLRRLPSRAYAISTFLATIALVILPAATAAVVLSRSLAATGGGLRGCGELVAAILRQPLGRPEVTASMVALAVFPVLLARGALSAWRSQSGVGTLLPRPGEHIVRLPCPQPVAFTAGILRPRVVVSDGLLDRVDGDQARVVIAHEEAHRRGRHPLWLFVCATLARAVPLPPVRWAGDAFRLSLEVLADEWAARDVQSRELVAETVANVALARAGQALGFEGDEVARVRRLLEGGPSRMNLLAAALSGGLLAAILFAGGHGVHCAARSVDALQVVQCRTPLRHG